MAVPAHLRRLVIERAVSLCEYCGLAQAGQEATFHIDHVLPVVEGGQTEPGNLALACISCSLRKGARRFAVDPVSGSTVPLFDPRREEWSVHFRWQGTVLEGITATGRATVEALDLNRPLIRAIREEESHWGRHPPRR